MVPTLLAETTTRTTYELGKLQAYSERWQYLVLALVCAAIAAYAVWMIKRDSVELRPAVVWLLAALRIVALGGLLAFYLHLEKRSERKVVHNSRVLVAMDTSLSMGLHDLQASAVPATPNRLEQVTALLEQGKFIDKLRQKHDVALFRFDSELARIAAFPKVDSKLDDAPEAGKQADSKAEPAVRPAEPSWTEAAQPRGLETRLGQSLQRLITEERTAPLAGIVVFSDGGQNAGVDPSGAVALAAEAKVPIFTVGLGSDKRPANVRVGDLVAPARAYPGDRFHITGYLQSEGMADRSLNVELLSRGAEEAAGSEGRLEGTERVTLGGRGEVLPVKFEIDPGEAGRRIYRLRVKAPPEDSNAGDNQQEVDVEIVDRKTKVMLIASGPTREYVFLRNLLHRDKQTEVAVWLQSGGEGMSQDAKKIFTGLPDTAQELFEYDCIVAFDPDWTQLDSAAIELLERWVAEKAGGLIVVAGPVEMDKWVQDPKMAKIRGLYPVEFNRRLTVFEEGRFGSTQPWPIDFTRDGLEAEFMWLADSAPASEQAWSEFPGVFGYYGVRGAKPGATVYGHYSDPEAGTGDERPVYMAGQFYGSGRVFYLGSGEMWRLRALDDRYFEQFYTKLVRYVSQGRLLVGSQPRHAAGRSRSLLAGQYRGGPCAIERCPVRAAGGSQRGPLGRAPDSTSQPLQLAADPARKGMYVGQFTALQEGTYRLEMDLPGSDGEQLSRRIQVRVPDLERESPERNDALLSEIAKRTGGRYYVGTESVLGAPGLPPLANQLQDRTEVTYLAGVTDRQFDERWMQALLAVICGALCLEWLIRRLSKLA